MDAFSVILKPSRLATIYLLAIYAMAAYSLYGYIDSVAIKSLASILLAIVFFQELRQQGLVGGNSVEGIRCVEGRWYLKSGGEWGAVEITHSLAVLPFCKIIYTRSWLAGNSTIYIWRDSLSVRRWRLLTIYLAVC